LTGGTGDDLEPGFIGARVQVFAFRGHDVHDLFARDLADFSLVWLFGAGCDVCRFLQKDRGGRTFGDERKRLVFKDSDHDRKNVPGLFLGDGVKFFAERHDVDAAWSERGANWRRRVRLTGGNLQFDLSYDFFRQNEQNLQNMVQISEIILIIFVNPVRNF